MAFDSEYGVIRFDTGELAKPVQLPNGYMQVEGIIGKAGLLTYIRADGSKWVELRPESEAFTPEVIQSFTMVPMTNTHPKEGNGLLDATNTRRYQRGTVTATRRDGGNLAATMLVTDADTIEDMQAGRRGLSMGYTCDVERSPGEYGGVRYDGIQRNVRGNHVALVDIPRAGPGAVVRMDSLSQVVVALDSTQSESQEKTSRDGAKKMTKVRIDGVEYEVSESAKQAFDKAEAASVERGVSQEKAIAELRNTSEKNSARADAAEAEVKNLKAQIAELPAKLKSQADARAALEVKAAKVLPEMKFDGLSDSDVRKAVVKADGTDVEGKSDAYVEARFDIAVEKADSAPGAMGGGKSTEGKATARLDAMQSPDVETARKARNAHLEDLWRNKVNPDLEVPK